MSSATCSGNATYTGPKRKKKTKLVLSRPSRAGARRTTAKPEPESPVVAGAGTGPTARRNVPASTAKVPASTAIAVAAPPRAMSGAASNGPTTVENAPTVDSTAFPARCASSGRSLAISVQTPAWPQECSTDEAASNAT